MMGFFKGCADGVHAFEPRYDELPTGHSLRGYEGFDSVKELRRLLVREVYVQDICVECGKVVDRHLTQMVSPEISVADLREHVAKPGNLARMLREREDDD